MMREGNQVIFDNVFPKLRQLLLGRPVTGRAALEWDIQPFSQPEKNRLHTPAWKRIFILVCDDSTIVDAVNDLGLREPLRSQWLTEERSWF
ncbi:hypothetical protein D7X96_09350 [Corallococcus interemptor]|uniref:Uncharacterized protein n=1 Tax=Corallococcus interemptor TaxID=2316720 RepID=A0A3A8QR92_9BACT|nr:hypothetical protein [Corallococcus interemptor]RKH71233.1 hypothetical protein D7X96_09350 [Corallococcus interemptor]